MHFTFIFVFALRRTGINQGQPCGHGRGAIHWDTSDSPMATPPKTMISFPPETFSFQSLPPDLSPPMAECLWAQA